MDRSVVYLIVVVLVGMGLWGHGYVKGGEKGKLEVEKMHAAADAVNAQYRQLEKEVADAQKAHLEVWRNARRDADAAWVQLKKTASGRVPQVCPVQGGPQTGAESGVEVARQSGGADVLQRVIEALEVGETMEATLALCQQELRQCGSR